MTSAAAETVADEKLLWSQDTVLAKLDVSHRTFRRWRANQRFPEPDMRMGAKLMWWKPETVLKWIGEQARG